MAKRKLNQSTRGINARLDGALGTEGTRLDALVDQHAHNAQNFQTEKVPPAQSSAAMEEPKGWFSQLPPLWKASATIIGTIGVITVSAVIWGTRLDTNVDNLKTNVTEIKSRTEDMFRASVQQGSRIDNLEKSVDAIKVIQALPAPPAKVETGKK